MLPAFKIFNLGSVFTKIKNLKFYTNILKFFGHQFRDLVFENFFKVFKIRPKLLVEYFSVLLAERLPEQRPVEEPPERRVLKTST